MAETGPDADGRLNVLPKAIRDSFEISYTPPEAANEYNGELIGDIPHVTRLVRQPFCTRLSREAQEIIAAGTTLIARKR